jgi:hydroxysqualene synthase
MADFRTASSSGSGLGLSAEPAARKSSGQENFPVASWLVAARLRPHVAAFYAFVRLADDIADDVNLDPDSKTAQLDALERALVSGIGGQTWLTPALKLKASLAACGVSSLHARQMLQAFRRDALGNRCQSWSDLLLYCRYSANPVGRYLLDLHGEGPESLAPADALSSALQILNHIQDCRSDWVDLGRCYLPVRWFREAGGDPEQLVEVQATPPVRAVLNRTLDQVDVLLSKASSLPSQVGDRGLRLESAVIIALARALSRQLRRRDPLADRVSVSAAGRVSAVLGGVVRGLLSRPARRAVTVSGQTRSSFYWSLRLLPPLKRQAMFALYAFCRCVDDLADEPGPLEERRAGLEEWRRRLDALYAGLPQVAASRSPADTALLLALSEAIRRYRLPRAEFDAILDGMIMDLDGPIVAPSLDVMQLYCRRVAGAVGVLSVRVFADGTSDEVMDRFAVTLGEALQLTNILRDLAEDSRMGRCYLPAEWLDRAGIPPIAAVAVQHPELSGVCQSMAELAQHRFDESAALLSQLNSRELWPAKAMMMSYQRLLGRLRQRGWQQTDRPVRLSKLERLGIALRCFLGRPMRN